MPSLTQIVEMNKRGWVLYYSKDCRYCHDVKRNMGPIKWAVMNKIECSNRKCPANINKYPTWYNSKTGATSSGVGVFR